MLTKYFRSDFKCYDNKYLINFVFIKKTIEFFMIVVIILRELC